MDLFCLLSYPLLVLGRKGEQGKSACLVCLRNRKKVRKARGSINEGEGEPQMEAERQGPNCIGPGGHSETLPFYSKRKEKA